jgi:hypothetical protein
MPGKRPSLYSASEIKKGKRGTTIPWGIILTALFLLGITGVPLLLRWLL